MVKIIVAYCCDEDGCSKEFEDLVVNYDPGMNMIEYTCPHCGYEGISSNWFESDEDYREYVLK